MRRVRLRNGAAGSDFMMLRIAAMIFLLLCRATIASPLIREDWDATFEELVKRHYDNRSLAREVDYARLTLARFEGPARLANGEIVEVDRSYMIAWNIQARLRRSHRANRSGAGASPWEAVAFQVPIYPDTPRPLWGRIYMIPHDADQTDPENPIGHSTIHGFYDPRAWTGEWPNGGFEDGESTITMAHRPVDSANPDRYLGMLQPGGSGGPDFDRSSLGDLCDPWDVLGQQSYYLMCKVTPSSFHYGRTWGINERTTVIDLNATDDSIVATLRGIDPKNPDGCVTGTITYDRASGFVRQVEMDTPGDPIKSRNYRWTIERVATTVGRNVWMPTAAEFVQEAEYEIEGDVYKSKATWQFEMNYSYVGDEYELYSVDYFTRGALADRLSVRMAFSNWEKKTPPTWTNAAPYAKAAFMLCGPERNSDHLNAVFEKIVATANNRDLFAILAGRPALDTVPIAMEAISHRNLDRISLSLHGVSDAATKPQ